MTDKSRKQDEKKAGENVTAKPDAEKPDAGIPSYRLVAPQVQPEDSFADGAHGFTVGRNVIKLDLYRVVGFDREANQEVRTHSHRIVLPLTAVPEIVKLLQQYEAAIRQLREKSGRDDAASDDG